MPSTLVANLIFDHAGSGVPSAPKDWVPPPQSGFDWNQDGQPDEMLIGERPGTIEVRWATGSLVVTDVRTTFDSMIYDRTGRPFLLYTRGSEIRPAAVGDVTGDGYLDLVVANNGDVNVLVGAGPAAASATYRFADVGISSAGWQNPAQLTLPGV